jgi:predicted nucleic acid-binding protein
MAEHFFDTSAAVKHYLVELGTPRVDALLADPGSRHFLSTLSVVEAHSVLARCVRTGYLAAADFPPLSARLLADVAAGLWQAVPVVDADFDSARALIAAHGLTRALYAADALQLAVALRLRAGRRLDAFVCADAALGHAAAAEGFAVVNPEAP